MRSPAGGTSGVQAAPSRGMLQPWRAGAMAAVLTLAVMGALWEGLRAERSAPAPSAALSSSTAAYLVRSEHGMWAAGNPAQSLSSSFTGSGVSIGSAAIRLKLSLSGLGYGSVMKRVDVVAPRAHANRVVYAHAGLDEWYANGPLGIEQGFTVTRAPAGRASGPLTLSIALSGNARASLAADARSITFTHAGSPALNYGGLTASDARGHTLPSSLGLAGGRLLLRVNTTGARYPVRIDPFFKPGTKLTGAGQPGSSGTGSSVAFSADGNTALVGAAGQSAVYVFTRSGESWTQQGAALHGSGAIGGSGFGASVALSQDGNTALIGGDSDNSTRGAAWVFTRSGETWTQQGGKLTGTAPPFGSQAHFGSSVALSSDGNTALVGARRDHENVGYAFVFTRSGEAWTLQQRLAPSDETGEGEFGEGVALAGDGNTALIGGGHDNVGLGAAWVFTRSGETWTQEGGKLLGAGESSSEKAKGLFGGTVALSKDASTALIGARGNAGNSGAAWVFTHSGESWSQQAVLGGVGAVGSEKNPVYFASSLALSSDGNAALIGAPGDAKYVGAAWPFTRSGETWTQQGSKLADGGSGVALSGDGSSALVGDPYEAGGGAGWLYVPKPAPTTPDFGRCKQTRRSSEGDFQSAGCTALKSGGGSYEWLPGTAKSKFTTTITEATAVLETVKASKVVCTGESGTGEYTGLQTVSAAMTFTGCERPGEPCTSSGASTGEISTLALQGILGIEKLGETHARDKLALDFSPAGGPGTFMQFSCGATSVSIRGSVILPLVATKMEAISKQRFLASKGKQKPERLAAGPKDVLEASFNGRAFEQIGLTVKVTKTNEEAVEANPAF